MKAVEPIKDIKIIKNMRAILKAQSTRNELLFIKNGKTPQRLCTITEKKTNKTKNFYIGNIVKKVIETYLRENKNLKDGNYIFKSRRGENKPITRQQAYRLLNGAAESLGLIERDEKRNNCFGRNWNPYS